VVSVKQKPTPALDKYMLDMGFSEEKITQLETALLKLGTASGCNMKDD
jgi:hypothetical protein